MAAEYHRVGVQVEVIETLPAHAADEAGRRGVVLEVRRYPDGSYRYGLGFMLDGEMGGLYPGDWLRATGECSALDELRVIRRAETKHSTRVSVIGDVLGSEEYVVLEKLVD